MIRFVLWLIILFIIFKIVRIVSNRPPRERRNRADFDLRTPEPPKFDDIQDADFEDLTPKPPKPS